MIGLKISCKKLFHPQSLVEFFAKKDFSDGKRNCVKIVLPEKKCSGKKKCYGKKKWVHKFLGETFGQKQNLVGNDLMRYFGSSGEQNCLAKLFFSW